MESPGISDVLILSVSLLLQQTHAPVSTARDPLSKSKMFIPSTTPRNCGADLYLRSKETELERECRYKNQRPSTEKQTLLYVPWEDFLWVSLIPSCSSLCIYFIFPLLPYPVTHLTSLRSFIQILSYFLFFIYFLFLLRLHPFIHLPIHYPFFLLILFFLLFIFICLPTFLPFCRAIYLPFVNSISSFFYLNIYLIFLLSINSYIEIINSDSHSSYSLSFFSFSFRYFYYFLAFNPTNALLFIFPLPYSSWMWLCTPKLII